LSLPSHYDLLFLFRKVDASHPCKILEFFSGITPNLLKRNSSFGQSLEKQFL
jgi:hypothetical protein